ncbi:DoxX family protein [Nodosilinea nodulosa]|uniref:DoxX family protein n=1 Tax=Nodosilinea nodulosa TaxID=416001 RepID=UPI0002E3FB4B|nr:DoxX family protein [Nodosilinea nodulosa]
MRDIVSLIYTGFPAGVVGIVLLLFRVGIGVLFMRHGYPKLTHLKTWANSLNMPIFLCFLSALSMFAGGACLILGFLTPLASVAILGSMVVAVGQHIAQGKPFMARDPYLIPDGQYEGPSGKGEPPSWEKAFMYCLILMVLAVLGPGFASLDAVLFAP